MWEGNGAKGRLDWVSALTAGNRNPNQQAVGRDSTDLLESKQDYL